jgi:hypothetical protein
MRLGPIGEADRQSLHARQRRRGNFIPFPLRDHGHDRFGAVGFVARPFGELPTRGEHRQQHAACLAAILDFPMPVASLAKPRLVEPHREPSGDKALMQYLGVGQVGRGVTDEAVVGHRWTIICLRVFALLTQSAVCSAFRAFGLTADFLWKRVGIN